MDVLVKGPIPEVEALIERRRALGLDGRDEMWEGVYHMTPHAHSRRGRIEGAIHVSLGPYARAKGLAVTGPFNIGNPNDFRVPDMGIRGPGDDLYLATAEIVIEILSPNDESYAKIPFYVACGVKEIWMIDPSAHALWIHERHIESRSEVLDLRISEIERLIDWP